MIRHRMLPVSRRRSPAQSGHRKTVWTTSQKATWKKKTAWWTRRNWTPLARNTGISGQSWALLSRRWINVRHNAPVSGFPQGRSGIPQGFYWKRSPLGWKSLLCDFYMNLRRWWKWKWVTTAWLWQILRVFLSCWRSLTWVGKINILL